MNIQINSKAKVDQTTSPNYSKREGDIDYKIKGIKKLQLPPVLPQVNLNKFAESQYDLPYSNYDISQVLGPYPKEKSRY